MGAYKAALAMALLAGAAMADQLTPDVVLQRIKAVGTKQSVVDYCDKPGWSAIVQGISTGSPNWLRVYTALQPAADAGAAEDLGEAIFSALPLSPFEVIPLLTASGHYTVEQVCTFTFEASVPPEGIGKYLTRLEQSLAKGQSAHRRSVAADCRHGIDHTRRAFKDDPLY